MTTKQENKLRSRFYIDEIARWLLVVFFFLAFTVYYFSDEPDEVSEQAFYWLSMARDLILCLGLLMLAIGNSLRLKGSVAHRRMRHVWIALAIVFSFFWLFWGSSWLSPQLA